MFSESEVSPQSVLAYRETQYGVLTPQPYALLIDAVCAPLLERYASTGRNCCAYVTAFNPFSEQVSDQQNAEGQLSLKTELDGRGLQYLEGIGQHPSNQWPGEPSVLILGIDLEASKVLGSKYQQNAIVWAGPDAVPKLILLR